MNIRRNSINSTGGSFLGFFYHQCQIIKRYFTNFVFPPFCPICERELKGNERLICNDCYNSVRLIEAPFCRRCGAPLKNNGKPCVYCKNNHFHFSRVRALGTFSSPLSEMIHLLKYDRKTSIAEHLGILLGNLLLSDPELSSANTIIPIPLHKTRMRERGYNQSRLLAEMVSSISHKRLSINAVIRAKATKSQTQLAPGERAKNLKDAFTVVSKEMVKNRKIIVVDDVMTSGATLDEISKPLLEAGAETVYGLILARAIGN